MRSIVAVAAGIMLMSFTACSETSQEMPEAQEAASGSTSDQSGLHVSAERHQVSDGHQHDSDGHQHGGHEHSKPAGDGSSRVAVGDKVPDFEFTMDGKRLKLSELQKNTELTENGTLVLTFWCSFCHSCRDVEQHLDKLAKQYHGRVGVIALDASAGETTEVVTEFARKNGLSVPIALNSSGTAASIFGARVTTTTVVIDSKGVLRYCGQFGDGRHAFAAEALEAVLAGEEVRVKKTKQKG